MQLIRASCKPETPSKQPTETFTGTVYMQPILTGEGCMANDVCFSPGARTFWHKHERGQILIVKFGEGLICSEGEQPLRLKVGDVVHVPPGEMHWHGGSSTNMMAHTAISMGKTSWMHELEQGDYEKAHETAS